MCWIRRIKDVVHYCKFVGHLYNLSTAHLLNLDPPNRYSCYYSSIKIVGTYYHQDESGNEMEERKDLIRSLNALVSWKAE